jgi:hypothetical protein
MGNIDILDVVIKINLIAHKIFGCTRFITIGHGDRAEVPAWTSSRSNLHFDLA